MKKFFLFLISIIIIIGLKKIGVFDPSIIKVDSFFIKKPFLYRSFNLNSNYELKSYDSKIISFFKYDGSYIIDYSIKKIVDKNKYKIQLEKNNLNFNRCYIFKDKVQNIVKVEVYKYPYIISFNEISKERKEFFLKQICKNSK